VARVKFGVDHYLDKPRQQHQKAYNLPSSNLLAIFNLRVLGLHHVILNLRVLGLHRVILNLRVLASTMSSSTSDPVEPPPQVSTRPPPNRSRGWNVHIYDAKDTTTMLGGLFVDKGITNANFYSMVEILVMFSGTFFLRDEGHAQIEKDDHPLRPGKYYIIATGGFSI
jgi:hypothetical protein